MHMKNACSSFLCNFCLKTFLILRRTAPDIITNVHRSSCKVPAVIHENWIFSTDFRKIPKFHLFPSCGSQAVPCGQTDGQTWRSEWPLFTILRTHLKIASLGSFIYKWGALCVPSLSPKVFGRKLSHYSYITNHFEFKPNPLMTKRRSLYLKTHSYRAVTTFHLGYKNRSVYAVSSTSLFFFFSDKYKTHKYSVGRTYSCWMLNCWCITWPVGFKRLNLQRLRWHPTPTSARVWLHERELPSHTDTYRWFASCFMVCKLFQESSLLLACIPEVQGSNLDRDTRQFSRSLSLLVRRMSGQHQSISEPSHIPSNPASPTTWIVWHCVAWATDSAFQYITIK